MLSTIDKYKCLNQFFLFSNELIRNICRLTFRLFTTVWAGYRAMRSIDPCPNCGGDKTAQRALARLHSVFVCYPMCLTVIKSISYKELSQCPCYYLCLYVSLCVPIFIYIAVISAVNLS